MSSDEITIRVSNLSKRFEIYDAPRDRLKQFVMPHLQRLAGQTQKQYFREFWALYDISFEVKKGETVGIIGRNGSGKSTLLQIICGTLTPTQGTVETRGRIAALLELGSGFNPEFTGRENVYMNASVLGLSNEEIDARYQDIVTFADIGDFIDQPVKTYSSGMMVRLAFAVIAHVDADILVIDEALAVGDAFFTQKCMRFLRKFMEVGTVLFVSHDTSSVINLCDRTVWLNKGVIQEIGQSKDVCELYLNSILCSNETGKCEANDNDKRDNIRFKRLGDTDLWRDQRADFINSSNLRNDLELFTFNEDENNFGGIEAQIVSVSLIDGAGYPLQWVVGGEKACLRIEVETYIDVNQPIIGFMIKDRLGQAIFGDNTYLSFTGRDCAIGANGRLVGEFEFYMPWLAQGDYSIQVAFADGTQEIHRQLHWMHNALMIRSHHSPVSTGIIGIPMKQIRLYKAS